MGEEPYPAYAKNLKTFSSIPECFYGAFPANQSVFFSDNTPADRKVNESDERLKRVQFKRQTEENLMKIQEETKMVIDEAPKEKEDGDLPEIELEPLSFGSKKIDEFNCESLF
jgi:hypothetical protein